MKRKVMIAICRGTPVKVPCKEKHNTLCWLSILLVKINLYIIIETDGCEFMFVKFLWRQEVVDPHQTKCPGTHHCDQHHVEDVKQTVELPFLHKSPIRVQNKDVSNIQRKYYNTTFNFLPYSMQPHKI